MASISRHGWRDSAEVGGICISRAVHEQVANKLSVQFADIGAQEVKNIPTPVHAFWWRCRLVSTYATPQLKKTLTLAAAAAAPHWMWPLVVAVVAGRDRRHRFSLLYETGNRRVEFAVGEQQRHACACIFAFAGKVITSRSPPRRSASAAGCKGNGSGDSVEQANPRS